MPNSTDMKFHKTVIINRAVSGSGKTTLSRCVTNALLEKGLTVAAHSTDDYFMKQGRYVFDLDTLSANHHENLTSFIADLERNTDVVICDNMNLLPWQSQPYTNAARKYNYRILFLNFLPRELEKHLAAQVVTAEKPDAHGIPKETLEIFIQNFNDYNDLLDKNTIRDIKRHRVFVWNDVDKIPMDTGEIAPYFDSDAVITIRPEQYQEYKKTLAEAVLQFITQTDETLKQDKAKKHYLLTWYGITDIRAALGLESTVGPVLGALCTGNYTDVIILGYTNPNKPKDSFSDALQAEWEKLRSQPLETRLAIPRSQAQVFVDAICNTEKGHSVFQAYLQAAKLPVRIHFVPQVLSHLNDARAIDLAAQTALRLALSDKAEKDITCFLSPGTPVMAYTWAMVSRLNPNLRLHVIASSDPHKPPEEINLPKDIISSPIIANHTVLPITFDVLIHLLGTDTNIPQYFSIVQFPAQKHWVITSEDSDKVNSLQRLLPEGATIETRIVNAFIPAHTRKAIEQVVQSLPPSTRIGVNLTGGTKLMFAGGLSACNEFSNTEPFYFDIKQHNITFLKTGEIIPFIGVKTIDEFFTASGYDISTRGYWDDLPIREARKELTLKLWKKRKLLGQLYQSKEFRAYNPPYGKSNPPFHFLGNRYDITFNGFNATLKLEGESLIVPDCTDFGAYLGGGWLEEYAYLYFLPQMKSGKIHDLRIGVNIVTAGHTLQHNEMPFGEFDCVYTDSKRLFIVECKAGSVKQEYVQKLENNIKKYGGISARGILFSAFPVPPAIRNRIATSTSIQTLYLK